MRKIVGILLIVIGTVWIGQGLGYIGGSFMTNQMQWAWIGGITALVGVGLMFVGRRG